MVPTIVVIKSGAEPEIEVGRMMTAPKEVERAIGAVFAFGTAA